MEEGLLGRLWMHDGGKSMELLQQGRLLRRQDKNAAIACFEQCFNRAEAENDRILAAMAGTELALELIETGHMPSVHKAKDILLKVELSLKDCADCNQELAYLLYCQGCLDLQQGCYVDALLHLQSAYQTYGEADPIGLSLVDDALGSYYAAVSDPRTASMHLRRSLSRRQEPGCESDKAISLALLGKVNLQLENYEQAENFLEQSLDLALQCDHTYTRLNAMTGLGQLAIAQSEWEIAAIMFQEALQIVQEPIDLSKAAYLYVNLAEALLGGEKIDSAQRCIETEAVPRFQHLQDQLGLAISKRLLGRILTCKLLDGGEGLTEEMIEKAEDYLSDASMLFEQRGMSQEYAKTLYDQACLYNICASSNSKYQYQGKSVRSLELALNVLEQFGSGSKLTHQIETLLNKFLTTN
jgi:tetratricopeptide (TPR) repeat protein